MKIAGSEQSLVWRLKQQSAEAFEELVTIYARRLYHVSIRILRNPQDAEDAVQETFLKAFQTIGSFREECALYTWLYRIVCNQSLAKLRKQGQRQFLPVERYLSPSEYGQHAEQVLERIHVPDIELWTRELAGFYRQCLDQLPSDYRIVYVLKDVEQLPEHRVCRILGITKPAMKNRVHNARLVVRKCVQRRSGSFSKPVCFHELNQ